jgi:uncharacterized protein
MMITHMRRFAVFARWPESGLVKTRLSPALPPVLANRLYEGMLRDALSACEQTDAGERLLYWADAPGNRDSFPVPSAYVVRDQDGTDLGHRLRAAFDDLLADSMDRAVVIGADCPDLDAPRIEAAFAALEIHDLVVGPTPDGGYYLIGLRRPAPELFDGVSWGTERVLEETLARARPLSVSLLDHLADLDTPADLVAYVARRCGAPETPARHTDGALRNMGLLPPA